MRNETVTSLSLVKEVRVRFSETDPLGVVWHGFYIQYFEDAREEFGRQHGISYLDQERNGFATPIIRSSCEHKLPLRYGDIAKVKITYVDTPAAKMIFRYEILNAKEEVVCKGETVQVFFELGGNMWLTIPDFFKEWKQKNGLLDE